MHKEPKELTLLDVSQNAFILSGLHAYLVNARLTGWLAAWLLAWCVGGLVGWCFKIGRHGTIIKI